MCGIPHRCSWLAENSNICLAYFFCSWKKQHSVAQVLSRKNIFKKKFYLPLIKCNYVYRSKLTIYSYDVKSQVNRTVIWYRIYFVIVFSLIVSIPSLFYGKLACNCEKSLCRMGNISKYTLSNIFFNNIIHVYVGTAFEYCQIN